MKEPGTSSKRCNLDWRKSVGNLSLILAGLLSALCFFEVGLRVAGLSYTYFVFRADPDLGWVLRPDVHGLVLNEAGWVFLQTNHDGIRDVEHEKTKPKGAFRIAILGDSFTEAPHVPVDKTFWWQVQERLEQCPTLSGRKPEVINFGVDGYGPAQELLTLKKRVTVYSPDAVILLVCVDNDLLNNSPVFDKSLPNGPRPYFQLRNGRLQVDNTFRNSPEFAVRLSLKHKFHVVISDHLRIVALIDNLRTQSVGLGNLLWNVIKREVSDSDQTELYHGRPSDPLAALYLTQWQTPAVSGRAGPDWVNTWSTFQKILAQMRDEVRRRNGLFLVVVASSYLQVYPNATVRGSFQKKWGVDDLFSINRRIQMVGREEGFEVLDLGPPLQRYADEHHAYLHGFGKFAPLGEGHWNTLGHQVAADLIAAKICRMVPSGY